MLLPDNINLVQTCEACPEQYDAFVDGETVGYLRLRHGYFSVECPAAGGLEVFSAWPEGDGCFTDNEREKYLQIAKIAISDWKNRWPSGPRYGEWCLSVARMETTLGYYQWLENQD